MPIDVSVARAHLNSPPENQKRIDVLLDTNERMDTSEKREAAVQAALDNIKKGKSETKKSRPLIRVLACDWGIAASEMAFEYGVPPVVLNMANATYAGGGVLQGAIAQEENMFRRTTALQETTNDELSTDPDAQKQGIYRKEITAQINKAKLEEKLRVCIKGPENPPGSLTLGYDLLPAEKQFPFYELRSAALDRRRPGYKLNSEHLPFTPDEKLEMRKKIAAQLDACIEANQRHLILSAFGCGAFKCPANEVSNLYLEEIEKRPGKFDAIDFAVYTGAGYGPAQENFEIFKKTLAPSAPKEEILKAMDAAIQSLSTFTQLYREDKKQQLEKFRNAYEHSNSSSGSEAIANFVKAAAEQRKNGWFTARYGETKSLKTFYEKLNTDQRNIVEDALQFRHSEKNPQFKEFSMQLRQKIGDQEKDMNIRPYLK